MKSQKVTFQKSQKLLAGNLHERPLIQNIQLAIHSISEAGYVTAVLAIVRTELRAREANSFCECLKNDLLRFHLILFFFDSSKRNFF